MLQTVHLISLAMAAVAAVWAVAMGRSPNATAEIRRASASTLLIALAVIIGITPQALLPDNEMLRTAGPVTSIVLSVITLLVMRRWRSSRHAS
jgi:heme A synthase